MPKYILLSESCEDLSSLKEAYNHDDDHDNDHDIIMITKYRIESNEDLNSLTF